MRTHGLRGINSARHNLGGRRGGGGAIPAPFQSVNADGWSVTYASPVVSSPEEFTVSRQGYVGTTPTTISENLFCTTRVRQVYPNQASLTADRVALSDYIYSTDTIPLVTNNSAEVSPKPVANWALPDRSVVGDNLVAEVVAFHRNARDREQVAAVEFIATDGSNTVSQVVTTSVVSSRANDRTPVVVYRCNLDVSGLANPATITLNAKVYPHIGGAASILDSSASSVAREFSPRFYRRDTSLNTSPVLVYVSTTGNDATGVVGTDPVAGAATPCATIGGALNRLVTVNGRVDGCRIRMMAGTHTLNSTGVAATRTQDYAHVTIERDPNASIGSVILQYGSVAFRPRLGASAGWLTIRDLTFNRTGATQLAGEAASLLRVTFEDMPFDAGSQNIAVFNSTSDGQFFGCTFSNLAAATLNPGAREIRALRGCAIPSAPSGIEGWLFLGNTVTSAAGAVSYGSRTASGSIAAFNRFQGVASGTGVLVLAAAADVTGAAFVQNVVEYTSATAGPSARVSADATTGNTQHIIIQHNSFAGFFINGRANIFYDDGPTARTNKLMSVRGNIHVQINTKGDVFVTDGARVGNWAYLYGVGCEGEFSQFIDADSGGLGSAFAQAYPGLNASIGTSSTVRNDPLFVDYEGTTSGPTAGAGGGNYALQSGSPAKDRAKACIRFDAAGVERSLTTSAGAYE